VDDAVGFGYVMEGHAFYQISFPSADTTWVIDATTGYSLEKRSFKTGSTQFGRHRANCYAYFDGRHLVGDYENGEIYEMDLDVYADDGEVMPAIRSGPIIHANGHRIFFNGLEIDFETGVGLITGQGDDPQAMLRWSDDMHTWSNEHWKSIGKIGEYAEPVQWHRLGSATQRVFEVSITDPVKRVITGARLLNPEIGRH
jgi:hypothetical protein